MRFKKALVPCAIVVFGVVAASAGYALAGESSAADRKHADVAESKAVVAELAKVLLLPKDGTPTVAKVEDVDQLKAKNATFYADLERGDYLVLYTTRAIIFRRSAGKVINVAPVVPAGDEQPR